MNIYFHFINFKCSTKIHVFSQLQFDCHEDIVRILLLIYVYFCCDISFMTASKILLISIILIARCYNIFLDRMISKILMKMITNILNRFVKINENLFAKRKYNVGKIADNQ